MNAFRKKQEIEKASLKILLPFVEQQGWGSHYVLTQEGKKSLEIQKIYGDILMNHLGALVCVEVKCEQENKFGNLYLETWSNRSRYTLGWMFTLQCDVLLYHFLSDDELYVLRFDKLREWAFHKQQIWKFEEKPEGQSDQQNDTWGRCVPIKVLTEALRLSPPYKPQATVMQGSHVA